jgi:hypothetical protein
MIVRTLAPTAAQTDLKELLAAIARAGGLEPFSAPLLDLLGRFSRRLFQDPRARQFAELQALAFWMRPAEMERLRRAYVELAAPGRLLAPRGLVFHIPPGNVDTIFVYSWLLAVLMGNANIIRLSPTAHPAATLLAAVFAETLAESSAELQERNRIISYGHETEITAAISAVCDMRVIWGGDGAVNTIRAVPLAPHAKELVFADRFSLAALAAPAVLDLDEAGLRSLAERFYNDAYWFDQMACSSPRLTLWCGPAAREASARFWPALAEVAERKRYTLETATRMEKLSTAAALAMAGQGSAYRQYGDSVNVFTLDALASFPRRDCGGGFFAEYHAESLRELAPWVTRRDQTLVAFGFSANELAAFATGLGGIDRIVPPGEALLFNRYWDGYDLLAEFSRFVSVPS